MTKEQFESTRFYKNMKIYWLGIEKEIQSVDFVDGTVGCSDGDHHDYKTLELED